MQSADSVTESTAELTPLEARVLGCLIEKEFTTPDVYPLTLNALVNACNQKSNRDPIMEVSACEVEVVLDQLRQKRFVALFSGADARVQKFRQKLDEVYPMTEPARALLCELLLRGPQTLAGLRGNSERMQPMPSLEDFPQLVEELADRESGALVRQLLRQPGQKETRWAQLLTGEPAATPVASAETLKVKVAMALPPEVEARLASLEAEMAVLRTELGKLKHSLGDS
ncbi:MAG: YceH family protein [Cephaloticoccus sp.]|nr:YceH family protein [Cephaloticoccus sp.]MCF7761140.1 YceH family protein [Cephaloticoccus sp.]